MKKNTNRSNCPISYALDLLGDKWSLLIIRDLVFDQKKFYKEFLQSKEKIATNILSDRLKRLEKAGLIESRVYEKLRTQKVYSLTEKGKDLIPVLVELILWSAKHEEGLAVTDEFVQKATEYRNEVVQNITSNLE
ncbi:MULTISPECIES: winged helix-turn-helix transcriptional regulator [unclassified Tenacibaculum]|uniref:winged helix-turn-helix transcriptional regulator n=1 Tax=unclassified Tenacibaculum TaxID=2635139 RepID=UPI001F25EB3A|nr:MULTISPECIES: helix-turn-helix domain-containing protein [unclassified Tenacibaculum]MCF2873242.1 helix-turn-helix transcriptional regulator [Tenacibaculum sp. Cn5-1]MCF2933398.1 helix-turn-helix transcriptional regulator [Tenacibaculum sp. Cn5-34]MCG7510021.1 helix-turn-helix transcriptional regulator [Tenacibaculum sp. Cn5-46]